MLTADQLAAYQSEGFLLLENLFADDEVALLGREFERLIQARGEATIFESGTDEVRGFHGPHLVNSVFSDLIRLERFMDAAEAVLDSKVYVHQFKINAKRALVGDLWEWHQDFQFWHAEDGLPRPRAVSFAIFLNEVTEFNGPLIIVPGSHTDGLTPVDELPGTWKDTLSASMRYKISASNLVNATRDRTLVAPKGAPGTVLMFDCNILHGSAPNMSAHDRRMAIISYNSVENVPAPRANPRPEFLAARDFTPLDRLPDNALSRHFRKSDTAAGSAL